MTTDYCTIDVTLFMRFFTGRTVKAETSKETLCCEYIFWKNLSVPKLTCSNCSWIFFSVYVIYLIVPVLASLLQVEYKSVEDFNGSFCGLRNGCRTCIAFPWSLEKRLKFQKEQNLLVTRWRKYVRLSFVKNFISLSIVTLLSYNIYYWWNPTIILIDIGYTVWKYKMRKIQVSWSKQ
jgi:hypothetical protein